MLVQRRFPPRLSLLFAVRPVLMASGWAVIVYALYAYAGLTLIRIPFVPIATVGTAVAFYVGFKNNSAYERFWEGRKIWGGVVNASRTWSAAVLAYVFPGDSSAGAQAVRRELVYRHLAWINALRIQLRARSRFFDKPARWTKRRLDRHTAHMRNDWELDVAAFLDAAEFAEVRGQVNPATQLVAKQAARLADLHRAGSLDLFHQIALMEVVTELYSLQGKAERIKNTPFPRQYAEHSRLFTRVFVTLVPFGLLDVFARHVDEATRLLDSLLPVLPMIVASSLITWVFYVMEGIGDSSEDPFERSMNDVPMNALCRTIEIDLRQMLGETELPAPEAPIDGILY